MQWALYLLQLGVVNLSDPGIYLLHLPNPKPDSLQVMDHSALNQFNHTLLNLVVLLGDGGTNLTLPAGGGVARCLNQQDTYW